MDLFIYLIIKGVNDNNINNSCKIDDHVFDLNF